MSFLNWLLGPYHYYQCHFGHRFEMRGHRLSRYQVCYRCSEIGYVVEAREIPATQEPKHAKVI